MDSNGNMESRLLPLLSDTSIRWRAGIQAIDLPTRVLAGDAVVARLRVRNEGEIRWPSALEQTTRPVRVYGRMQPASGRSAGQPFLVGAMPRCVAPEAAITPNPHDRPPAPDTGNVRHVASQSTRPGPRELTLMVGHTSPVQALLGGSVKVRFRPLRLSVRKHEKQAYLDVNTARH